MGQKVNPIGFRLNLNRAWSSKWYASKDKYADLLHEDIKIRNYIEKTLKSAGISKVLIERSSKKAHVSIHASKPGIIIGKKGQDISSLKGKIQKMSTSEVVLNIVEVRKPELDAKVSAFQVAEQIEKRVSFKKAMKRIVQNSLKMGAKGIKVHCSGRLNGAEIARTEGYKEGRVPLHTLRSDVDYGFAIARTTYGVIGIKVWIYRGDITNVEANEKNKKAESKNVATA